jgi:hypothetical protein
MISREARKHAKSRDLGFDFEPSHHTPLKLYGPLILLLARLLQLQRFTVLPSQGQPRDLETGNFETSCYVHQQGFSGTHKNLQRLVICPIYSVVKYRPREEAASS